MIHAVLLQCYVGTSKNNTREKKMTVAYNSEWKRCVWIGTKRT